LRRRDRRDARQVFEQRHLAEEAARPQRADLDTFSDRLGLPTDEDEELTPLLSLGREQLVRRQIERRRDLRDRLELFLGTSLEQPHVAQQFDLSIALQLQLRPPGPRRPEASRTTAADHKG